MAAIAKRRRRYMRFEGGPIDGGVEVMGSGEAPLYYVHRVMGQSGETAFHRYVRVVAEAEEVDGKDVWRYEHEGSVRG